MKVLYARATSEGEQINVEVVIGEKENAAEVMKRVYDFCDERLKEQNHRYLDALSVYDVFPPEYRASFKQAVDLLYARKLDRLQVIAQLRKKPEDGTGEASGENVIDASEKFGKPAPGPEVTL